MDSKWKKSNLRVQKYMPLPLLFPAKSYHFMLIRKHASGSKEPTNNG